MHTFVWLLGAWLALSGTASGRQAAPSAPALPPRPADAAVVAQVPEARPALPLWRVRAGDRTIAWLLGSIHALPREQYPLARRIDEAFEASGTLVEEVDLAEMERPETLQAAVSRAILLDGTTLDALVGPETWQAVRAKIGAAGLPEAAVQRMKPWMAAVALVAPVLLQAGFDPKLGVDRHFWERARERDMPVRGLETPAFQFDRLDGLERDVQVGLLKTTLEGLDRQVGEVTRVTAAWARGDVPALEDLLLDTFRESPRVYERLLLDRNRAWVGPVASCADEPAPCFVVVGTAHLIGPDGLVALLRQRGLTVEQQ